MKKLFLSVLLAVAFLFSVVIAAEAKIYHFEIDGVPYAAKKNADGSYDSFEVTAEYHAKFRQTSQKQMIAKQETSKKVTKVQTEKSKNIINTATKKEIPANNTADINTAKKVSEKPIASGANFARQNSITPKDTSLTAINVANNTAPKNISAPYNTGAPNTSVINTAKNSRAENNTIGKKGQILVESSEKDYPAADGNGHWTVSRKIYITREKNLNGVPIVREMVINKTAWTNLNKGGEIKKGFAWAPGQIKPPGWMSEIGGKLAGINPETGQICEMEIPVGYAINYDSRGNAAGMVGKFSSMPKDRHLLEKNIESKRGKSHV